VSRCRPTLIASAAFAASLVLLIGCTPAGGYKIVPIPADQTLKEQILYRGQGLFPDKVAIVDLNGPLINDRRPSLFGESEQVVSLFTEKLQRAAGDSRVKAVVLRINSPGGTVTASDLIHDEILRFRQRTGKKVIAMLMDVAASGGYYAACAADQIIAQPTSVTGSIGVVVMLPELAGLMDKVGVRVNVIKSGELKDAGSPFREMKPAERQYFEQLMNDFYERFIAVVDAGREGLDADQVRELADGRVFTADQALKAGLIDRIGTLHDAIAAAREAAGLKDAHVIIYHRPLDWTPTIYAESSAPSAKQDSPIPGLDLLTWWHRTPSPFLYLWCPGM
jgi:protease-4